MGALLSESAHSKSVRIKDTVMARKTMDRAVNRGMEVLMLVSDAHGGFGGIAQYNRDVIAAMSQLENIAYVTVLPRIMSAEAASVPSRVRYDRRSARNLPNFIVRSVAHALPGKRTDLVYCAHVNLLPVAATIAVAKRCPLVLAVYGIDAWQKPRGAAVWAALKAVSLVISISQMTLDRFRAWSGVAEAKCVILPNAIHADQYRAGDKDSPLARRLGVTMRPVILTFGRMSDDERYKGFDEVIAAMPRLLAHKPDLVFVAAGDGSDRSRLEAKAASLGVASSVIFPGRISEAEKADLYRLADAYVMPSSGEGFGFVILEALACGIPVVASKADGTREAVRGGELGLLVDPADQLALEHAVLEALSRPKAILPGLDYFSFAHFEQRLALALSKVVSSE
jgi:phosphatidylinositol alpha-1,6-mannosyltransferase